LLVGKTEPNTIAQFIEGCEEQDWIVYAKSSINTPDQVLDDLSRYNGRPPSATSGWSIRTASRCGSVQQI
jgi:hypothetical protein